MTVQKYVNSILRKVKCSKEKREEIRQQLLSDISAAMENGETPERVITRMGSVEDVAKEFNQNLPEVELKKYKKNRRIKIVCGIFVLLLLLGIGVYQSIPKSAELGSSGIFEQSKVEEAVKQVIEEINENDFAALNQNAADTMKNAISEESFAEAKKQITKEDWGAFLSLGNIYALELEQNGETIAMAQVTAAYENTGIIFTISFDKDMKLAGLYIK